jgi:hypothetical protein
MIQRIDNLGRREAISLAAGTTQRVFAGLTGVGAERQVVSLCNCDAAADLMVALAPSGTSAPTISSTDYDLLVPAKAMRQLQVGMGIDIWIRSNAAGSIAVTALEML